jgi:WD40 repeat protein
MVSAGKDETLKLWNGETGHALPTLASRTGGVRACAYSPNGAEVVGSQLKQVWDAETGVKIRSLEGRHIGAIAHSPDGARAVLASADGTLKVWDIDRGEPVRTLKGHGGHVNDCVCSPDGARVVCASTDGTLKLWDAETGRKTRTLAGHTGPVTACAYSPDGARVVSASEDRTVKLWDAGTGREIRSLAGHTGRVMGCAYSPDGAWIVSTSWDRTLRVWDAEEGECIATLLLLDGGNAAAHHPHRASVACGDRGGSVYLVDLVGITLGPLVVTAVDLGDGPAVRCPVCSERHPLEESWLGREMDCPGRACDARLRVNPFVARRAPGSSWLRRWWSRWRA